MSSESDLEYFRNRAVAEREMSGRTSDPAVKIIHDKLAERYERLASGLPAPRATLRIVGS